MAEDFLMHYGVPGMKWGVRRYQLKGSSKRTPEGKIRYAHTKAAASDDKTGSGKKRQNGSVKEKAADVLRAERSVKKGLSNKIPKIAKQPMDLNAVKQRGNLSSSDAKKCAAIADQMYDRAAISEPWITRDVVSAVKAAGGMMYGLKNRLKQPTSIAAKIGADAKEKGISIDSAARSVNDAVRYTSVLDDNKFVSAYHNIKNQLKADGYEELKCKNYFSLYKQGKAKHKSVQSVFGNKNNDRFEMQFHTVTSQAVKELKTPIYEERRKTGVSTERQFQLENKMTALAKAIQDPAGIGKIKSHSKTG